MQSDSPATDSNARGIGSEERKSRADTRLQSDFVINRNHSGKCSTAPSEAQIYTLIPKPPTTGISRPGRHRARRFQAAKSFVDRIFERTNDLETDGISASVDLLRTDRTSEDKPAWVASDISTVINEGTNFLQQLPLQSNSETFVNFICTSSTPIAAALRHAQLHHLSDRSNDSSTHDTLTAYPKQSQIGDVVCEETSSTVLMTEGCLALEKMLESDAVEVGSYLCSGETPLATAMRKCVAECLTIEDQRGIEAISQSCDTSHEISGNRSIMNDGELQGERPHHISIQNAKHKKAEQNPSADALWNDVEHTDPEVPTAALIIEGEILLSKLSEQDCNDLKERLQRSCTPAATAVRNEVGSKFNSECELSLHESHSANGDGAVQEAVQNPIRDIISSGVRLLSQLNDDSCETTAKILQRAQTPLAAAIRSDLAAQESAGSDDHDVVSERADGDDLTSALSLLILEGEKLLRLLPEDMAGTIKTCLQRERIALVTTIQDAVIAFHSSSSEPDFAAKVIGEGTTLVQHLDEEDVLKLLESIKSMRSPLAAAVRQMLEVSQTDINKLVNSIVLETQQVGANSSRENAWTNNSSLETNMSALIMEGTDLLHQLSGSNSNSLAMCIRNSKSPIASLVRCQISSNHDKDDLAAIIACGTQLMRQVFESVAETLMENITIRQSPLAIAISQKLATEYSESSADISALLSEGEMLLVRLAEGDAGPVLYTFLTSRNPIACEMRKRLAHLNEGAFLDKSDNESGLQERTERAEVEREFVALLRALKSEGANLLHQLAEEEAAIICNSIEGSDAQVAAVIRLNIDAKAVSETVLSELEQYEAGGNSQSHVLSKEIENLDEERSASPPLHCFHVPNFSKESSDADERRGSEEFVFDPYFFDDEDLQHEVKESPESSDSRAEKVGESDPYDAEDPYDTEEKSSSQELKAVPDSAVEDSEIAPVDTHFPTRFDSVPAHAEAVDENESKAIAAVGIDSCSTSSSSGYAEDFENFEEVAHSESISDGSLQPDPGGQYSKKESIHASPKAAVQKVNKLPSLNEFPAIVNAKNNASALKLLAPWHPVSSVPPSLPPGTAQIYAPDPTLRPKEEAQDPRTWLEKIQDNKKECPLILGGTHGHFQIQPVSGLYKLSAKNAQSKEFYFGHVKSQTTEKVHTSTRHVDTFLETLYEILMSEKHHNCIQWSIDGSSFIFMDPTTFQLSVIPLHFPGTWRSQCGALMGKGYDFAEILRILRGFGFKKSNNDDPDTHEYTHKYFVRGCKDDLFKIRKRRKNNWEFPSPAREVIRIDSAQLSPSAEKKAAAVVLNELEANQPPPKNEKDEKIRAMLKGMGGLKTRSKATDMSVFKLVQQLKMGKASQRSSSRNLRKDVARERSVGRRSSLVNCAPDAFLDKLKEQGHFNENLVGIGRVPPERGMRVKLTFEGLEHKMMMTPQPRSTLILLRGIIDDMEQDGGMCKVKWRTGEEEFCCTGFCGKYYLEVCLLDQKATDAKWWCQQALLAPTWSQMSGVGIWRMNRPKSASESRALRTVEKSMKELQKAVKGLHILQHARENVAQYYSRLRAEEARMKDERKHKAGKKKQSETAALASHLKNPAITPTEDVGSFFRSRGSLSEVVRNGEMALLEGLLRRTFDSLEHQPSGSIATKEVIFCISRMRVGATKQLMKAVVEEHDDGDEEFTYGGFLDLMYDLLSRCKVSKTDSMFGRRFAVTDRTMSS